MKMETEKDGEEHKTKQNTEKDNYDAKGTPRATAPTARHTLRVSNDPTHLHEASDNPTQPLGHSRDTPAIQVHPSVGLSLPTPPMHPPTSLRWCNTPHVEAA